MRDSRLYKRIRSKSVAVCLSVAMAMTAFTGSTPGLVTIHAEEGAEDGNYIKYTLPVDLLATQVEQIGTGAGVKFAFSVNGGADNMIGIDGVDAKLVLAANEGVSYTVLSDEVVGSGIEYKIVRYTSEDTVADYLSKADVDALVTAGKIVSGSIDANTTELSGDKIVVYARPVFDEASKAAIINKIKEEDSEASDDTYDYDTYVPYAIQKTYGYANGADTGFGWYNGGLLDTSSLQYVENATLGPVSSGLMPNIKYQIIPYNGGDIPIAGATWGDDNSLAGLSDGQYVGYVACVLENGTPISVSDGFLIGKDAESPTFVANLVEIDAENNVLKDFGAIEDDGSAVIVKSIKNKVADGNDLAIMLVAQDEGTGVASIEYCVNGGALATITPGENNNGDIIIINKGETNNVKVKISDKMSPARVTEKEYSIINDVEAPVIGGILIDGDTYDSNNVKKVRNFTLTAGPITDLGDSGLNTVSGKASFYKNNDVTGNPAFVCSDLAIVDDGSGSNISFKLSDKLNGAVLKGNYTIVVTAEDNVGNKGECTWEDIYIDTTVPACDNVTIYYRTKGVGDWKTLGTYTYDSNSGSFGSNNIVINPFDYYEYMYTVVDSDGDIASIDVIDECGGCASDNKTNTVTSAGGLKDTLYNSENDYTDGHDNRNLKFVFKNAVGTTKEANLPYTLSSSAMDVEGCRLKDSDGITIKALPSVTNEQYTFDVNVSSSHKIRKVSIVTVDENGNKVAYGSALDTIADNRFVPASGMFFLEGITLDIPNNMNKNVLLTKTYVEVVEDNYDASGNYVVRKIDLGTILYDMSKPVLKSFNLILNDDPSVKFDPNKWYKSASAVYTIDAGSYVDNKLESKLSNVECNIDAGYESRQVIQKTGDLGDSYTGSINSIDESDFVLGTRIIFNAADQADNPMYDEERIVKIDSTKPEVVELAITNPTDNGLYTSVPGMSSIVSDNLTFDRINVTVKYPDGELVTLPVEITENEREGIEKSFNVPDFSGLKPIIDGNYSVKVSVYDKAGNENNKDITFTIDRTLPDVTAKISGGEAGGKSPMVNFDGTSRDMYYHSNVAVEFTYSESNADISKILTTDNGQIINVTWNYDATSGRYIGSYVATQEGMHTVRISAIDNAGNSSEEKVLSFVKDTIAPTIATSIADNYISSEAGRLFFTSDVIVTTSASDTNYDEDDFYYSVDRKSPSIPYFFPMYEKTRSTAFNFSEEADYTVSFYCVDKAGNRSETRNVDFRIDKTSPELSINGVEDGGKIAGTIVVSLNMRETFYSDAKGKAVIYKKSGDGVRESLMKSIDINPTSFVTTINESFTETGEYRIEMEASDRVGHRSTLSKKFIVDTKAPTIKLSGVKNFDKTSSAVSLYSEISDDFYLGKKVNVSGIRIDIDGKKHSLDFSGFNAAANPTVIDKKFEEDGIYDIDINSVDAVGNSSTTKVHFTIDKTNPLIKDLPIKDGAYVNAFSLDFDPESYVKDLTVCNVRMYLNGSDYDGVDELEDGVYKLLITAEDELGHKSEKSVSFVYDTKAPMFAVEGVADGDIKDEDYNIKVGVQDDDDILTTVTLDGVSLDIKNNAVSLSVKEKGKHELKMSAKDRAGNTAEQTISFKYGEKTIVDVVEEAAKDGKHFPIVIILIAALLAGGFFVIILKRRKEKDN